MNGLLTLMGSGETAPTMVKVHRELVGRVGGPVVLLDTPYGFQENAPELAERAQLYFRQSIGVDLEVAGLPNLDVLDTLAREQGLSAVRRAQYLFAGPGSPTYALRQWAGTPVPSLLVDKLRNGGAVTFASAAALTLGRVSVPVYEIYKAGQAPTWIDGLDVLGAFGLHVAVIPHYDNTEGGHHDTRFCYLGERRLAILERALPDGHHVLGIDEHTGVVIDLAAQTATVVGNGAMTLRVQGRSQRFETGTTVPLDVVRSPETVLSTVVTTAVAASDVPASPAPMADTSLAGDTRRCEAAFDAAIEAADAAAAATAVLELDAAIEAWSADTLQSDEMDRAQAAKRSMIVRLGEAATGGLRDPREVVGPYLEVLMTLRTTVRAQKLFELSDLIRDQLSAVGVEVRDTPEGPTWHLH